MGWSLTGIIGGAMAGGGAAAEKILGAEREMEARTLAAKDLQVHASELALDKEKQIGTWKAKQAEELVTKDRATTGGAMNAAYKYASESGFEPGTPGFHMSAANQLLESGHAALAKDQFSVAEKIRTGDTADKNADNKLEIANAKLEAAGRVAAAKAGGAAAAAGVIDVQKHLDFLSKTVTTRENGKTEHDPDGLAVVSDIFNNSLRRPDVQKLAPEDRAPAALSITQAAVSQIAARVHKDGVSARAAAGSIAADEAARRAAAKKSAEAANATNVPTSPPPGDLTFTQAPPKGILNAEPASTGYPSIWSPKP